MIGRLLAKIMGLVDITAACLIIYAFPDNLFFHLLIIILIGKGGMSLL